MIRAARIISMNDLTLRNGRVITMDAANPLADFVAIRDGTIVAVGRGEPPNETRGTDIEVIDCGGKTVIPGVIDAHCHVASYAETFITLDLSPQAGIVSMDHLKEKIAIHSRESQKGKWIRGKRYDEYSLAERRHPTRWDLDAAAPDHPVRLSHRTGRAHVLNSLALKLVGIGPETEDPPNGMIDRDLQSGEPTGLLFGMGRDLSEQIPPLLAQEIERGAARASEKLLSYGITSVCDASAHNDEKQWNHFGEWKRKGLFRPRVMMSIGPGVVERLSAFRPPSKEAEDHLRLGPVKIIVDRTTGRMEPSRQELIDIVTTAHGAGLQVAIHAIEPEEIEAACDAIETALYKRPRLDHRHRIEHCSVCPPRLMMRIRRLGIVVVTQPSFVYFHGDRYAQTVAESDKPHLYRIGAMVRKGIDVAAGSDFPIADPNPFAGIYGATTRKTAGGQVVLPEEAIAVDTALSMYTRSAAVACREEGVKGSITVGKQGDLVVLERDPWADQSSDVRDTVIFLTVLDGRVVWRRA
jgi:predicted amidohydrolase YtcJ